MNKKKEKSNTRIIITFIAFVILCTVLGFLMGRELSRAENSSSFEETLILIKNDMTRVTPIVFIVTSVLGIILPLASFGRCSLMYKKLQKDKENYDLWDSLEDKLNIPVIFSNSLSIINLCLFFCVIHISMKADTGMGHTGYIIGFVTFAVSMFVFILISKLIIDMEIKLNPEKKGNPLDFQFQKVWLESCDEAQRLTVYKAGYTAFQVTNGFSMVFFVITFIIIELFKLDIFALVVLAVLMLVNVMSYMFTAAKLERRT